MNVLVIKPSSLGDIVHTFPAVQLIRRSHPDALITWVVNDTFAELVALCPAVDEVIAFKRRRWSRPQHWPELLGFSRDLRRHPYDLVLDFQGLLRSALIGLLARSPRRVGFRGAREGASLFYHEKVLLPANLRHAVERNLFLVRTALQAALPAESPELTCQPDLLKLANTLRQQYGLTGSGPVLAVAPAARWQSKMWPATFFAEVIDGVAGRLPEVQVWLLGTREEAAIGGAVMSACTKARPVDLTGETSTGVLMELLRQSSALLTNDTGPMHLAAALRVPTVALFGPTDPELTGPYGEQHVVLRGTCVRAPCFRDECSDAVCHASVPVSAAVDAVVARCLSRRMPTPSGPAAPPRAELQGVGASGLMPSVPRDSGWRAGHRQPGPLPF